MDGFLDHNEMLLRLKNHLEPVERASHLIDLSEGPHPEARKAAVLLPIFLLDGQFHLAFILRSQNLRSHSGEIAFPGGKADPGENFPIATALREAYEEIGLTPERVEVMGLLPPVYTVVTNYLIFPVVAFLPQGLGELHLQISEVTEVICVPLHALADPSIAQTQIWTNNGISRTVYFYHYASHQIWGATGRIVSLLLPLLSKNTNHNDAT